MITEAKGVLQRAELEANDKRKTSKRNTKNERRIERRQESVHVQLTRAKDSMEKQVSALKLS